MRGFAFASKLKRSLGDLLTPMGTSVTVISFLRSPRSIRRFSGSVTSRVIGIPKSP